MASKKDTILLARFSALGDVAMTIPALYSACKAWPDTDFVLVTRKAYAGIFINKPANLIIDPVDLKEEYSGPLAMLRLVRHLAAKYPSCRTFVDLHDVLRTKIMRAACRVRGWKVIKFDKGRKDKNKLIADNANGIAPQQPLENSVERYRRAIVAAGYPFQFNFSNIYGADSKGDPSLFEAVTPPKAPGEIWVGIAPFAAHALKQCPMHVVYDIAKDIAKKYKAKVFIFGAGAEEMRHALPLDQIQGVTSIIGRNLGWKGEMALMSHLDAIITMDSANMHLAALTGIPVVSIWGPTHPYCGFAPWNQPQERMVMPCSPCSPCSVFGNKPCPHRVPICMPAKPAPVIAAIDKILENRTSK